MKNKIYIVIIVILSLLVVVLSFPYVRPCWYNAPIDPVGEIDPGYQSHMQCAWIWEEEGWMRYQAQRNGSFGTRRVDQGDAITIPVIYDPSRDPRLPH